MSVLDQALEELCGVVDQAAQKTGEALETSKGQVERLRLRNRLNEKYLELGKAHFLTAEGENDRSEEMAKLMDEICELRNAYTALCRTLHRGGGVTCEKGGKYHRNAGAYCSDCGAAMPSRQE